MNMQIKMHYDAEIPDEVFKFNQQNRLIPQDRSILPTARRFTINAEGVGMVSFQVSHTYNTKIDEVKKGFKLTVEVVKNTGDNILNLDICTNYNPEDAETKNRTGMTLMEVAFPSGYVFDPDSNLLAHADIKVSVTGIIQNFIEHFYFRNMNYGTRTPYS